MKRTIYLIIALICTLKASAQFTQNETQTNSTVSNFQSLNQYFDLLLSGKTQKSIKILPEAP